MPKCSVRLPYGRTRVEEPNTYLLFTNLKPNRLYKFDVWKIEELDARHKNPAGT